MEVNDKLDKLIKKIESIEDLMSGRPATDYDIQNAEKNLNVCFAEDYKMYLKQYGFICFSGHELTGICDGKRLDVVKLTKNEKEYYENKLLNAYVIEQTHIDGIVIWQTTDGKIFKTQGNQIVKICDTLYEYISMFI